MLVVLGSLREAKKKKKKDQSTQNEMAPNLGPAKVENERNTFNLPMSGQKMKCDRLLSTRTMHSTPT